MEGSSSIYVPGLTNPRGGVVKLCLYSERLMDKTQKVSQRKALYERRHHEVVYTVK